MAHPTRFGRAPLRLTLLTLGLACTGDSTVGWPDGPMPGSDGAVAGARGDLDGTRAHAEADVVTAAARDGSLVLWVAADGVVRAAAAVTVRAERAGTIARVAVREGRRVRVGDPLVSLDTEPFELAVREAEAHLAEAEQRVADSYRPESLVTGHLLSAEQRRARLVRAGVLSARVAADRARRDQARGIVRSPLAGTIDRLFVGPGDQLHMGQPVAQVVDASHLLVDVPVLEYDLPRIRPGASARVRSVADPTRGLTAQVVAVLPTVDTTSHAGRVLLRLPVAGRLRPGMSVAVELEGERLERRRLVPNAAILERDGRTLVFVLRDGRAHWTFVHPGRSNGMETELLPDSVTGALAVPAGARVLVDGHQTLTHEAPVRVRGAIAVRPP